MPILVFNLMYLSTVQKPSPNETDLEDTRSFFFFSFLGEVTKPTWCIEIEIFFFLH